MLTFFFFLVLVLRFLLVHKFLASLIGSTTISYLIKLSFAFSFLFLWLGIISSRNGCLLHHPILPPQCRLVSTDLSLFALFVIGSLSEDHIAIVAEVATGKDFVVFIMAHGGRSHGGVGCNN